MAREPPFVYEPSSTEYPRWRRFANSDAKVHVPHLSSVWFAGNASDACNSPRLLYSGKSKWGLSNGGLRPLSAICAQSCTIVHFCGLFGPLSEGTFRHKMTTIVGNRGQLWTSTLSPHLESPHLDFPDLLLMHAFRKTLEWKAQNPARLLLARGLPTRPTSAPPNQEK